MSSISKKRKQPDGLPKYYGVRAGHQPGVYMTWPECQGNVTGFKGALYKSFTTQKDAEDFVAGKAVVSSKPQEPRFYGVAVGHKPGVYEDWELVLEQTRNFKGPKYKKFATRAEAEEFVRTGGKISKVTLPKTVDEIRGDEPAQKKPRIGVETTPVEKKVVVVHTDGSSKGNGKVGALAGVGVFFGENDPRNVSEALEGAVQTNQRAELTAIQRALEIIPDDADMEIKSDSRYAIDCSTNWYVGWQRKGWKTASGTAVMNKDLVVQIRVLIDQREYKGTKTQFTWVKGHANDPGNVAADRLAVTGAMKPRR